MNKNRIYLMILISIVLIISIISFNKGKNGIVPLYGYTAACNPPYVPEVINAMDDGNTWTAWCSNLGAPIDAYGDTGSWKAEGFNVPTPVISAMDLNVPDSGSPNTGTLGSNFLRVLWTDMNQSIILPAAKFESVGCGAANNWSCYDYVGFNVYLNYLMNYAPVPQVPMTVAFYDGVFSVTTTSHPVIGTLNDGLYPVNPWKQHVSVSIKWLANQYSISSAAYFNVSNIQSVTILAPNVDYTQFSSSGYNLYAYYDALKLGNGLSEYASPTFLTITTVNAGPINGAYVNWDNFDDINIVGNITPTAYELYRSITGGPAGPYVLVNGSPVMYNPSQPSGLTDTACPGGGVFCYKIMTSTYGPNPNTFTAMANTVNASYHQDLLANVTPVCGWVNAVPPTATPTQTPGGTPPVSGTATITPTFTPTVSPTIGSVFTAHVYPNPFNPRKGSRLFHVDNVVNGTKISIFAMDGALVKNGEVTGLNGGRFEWNGQNKNGKAVVAGLYYLVLEDPNNNRSVKRIIVCYADDCDPVY